MGGLLFGLATTAFFDNRRFVRDDATRELDEARLGAQRFHEELRELSSLFVTNLLEARQHLKTAGRRLTDGDRNHELAGWR